MSVVFTGTNQGRFVADGNPKVLQIRSDVDWMWVKNETVSYAGGAGTGAEFYWQRGMTQGRGTVYTKTASTNALAVAQIAASSGFYLIDSSDQTPGAALALTGITNANPPVVNTSATSTLRNGDVVRILQTVGALQLGGIDFTIGSISAGVSFELAYAAAIVSANPGAGTFRRIPFDPIYYPRKRVISKISKASQAIVTMTVTHGYLVGQKVRFVIPQAGTSSTYFGMTELNGIEATIVAVGAADADGITNTITVDVDTSGFTTFAWPLTASGGFTPAQVIPVGENTAEALSAGVNILNDATVNQAYIGMLLQPGTSSPAGASSDVIYWVAGKSFSVDNN